MQLKITLTTEQIEAALAHVWGCSVEAVHVGPDTAEITTDLKGAQRAERALAKVQNGAGQ